VQYELIKIGKRNIPCTKTRKAQKTVETLPRIRPGGEAPSLRVVGERGRSPSKKRKLSSSKPRKEEDKEQAGLGHRRKMLPENKDHFSKEKE